MNRKVMKVLSIVLVAMMAIMMLSQTAFATDETKDYLDPNFNFKSNDQQTAGIFGSFIATIINIAQVVGMGVAIIMLVVMAIKYISAAPSEKAELKKSMVIYVVGALVLFAATAILQILKNFATANITNNVNATAMLIDMVKVYLG